MISLGSKRGYLSDWITQRWVQFTGRRVSLASEPWLAGPIAPTTGIGPDYFAALAGTEGLRLEQTDNAAGIISNFATLRGAAFEPSNVHPSVTRFYEQTSAYELDAWAEWCGLFRPFGWLLAVLFSRRLQQLNVPLSGLDTSKGLTSEVLQFIDPASGSIQHTAWFRRLRGSGNVLYAGFYSVCTLPGHADPCVKVVFPLPNGNAIIVMRTECRADGSFVVTSAGDRFGEPGFYFTLHGGSGIAWARYVKAVRESIHVYPAENGLLRADHLLTYFGATFLRLHYCMRRQPNAD
ncbi:MAG: hypothetical protein JWL59_3002 [Chthoniobacteraceae bacterium]|nr:hypothetical protein [Chthoniobacteraceae bacterium]